MRETAEAGSLWRRFRSAFDFSTMFGLRNLITDLHTLTALVTTQTDADVCNSIRFITCWSERQVIVHPQTLHLLDVVYKACHLFFVLKVLSFLSFLKTHCKPRQEMPRIWLITLYMSHLWSVQKSTFVPLKLNYLWRFS